jgi:hypothetical protein
MSRVLAVAGLIALCPLLTAGEKEAPPDYTEFSKLLRQTVLRQVPREHEEKFNWGHTIPVTEPLRLPRLRAYVKVGNHIEVPHGAWRRVRVKLLDPDRDFRLAVRDLRPVGKLYRIVIDAEVTVFAQGEWQQWQKGLLLLGENGDATATIATSMACDVDVSFDYSKFPPALDVKPKVAEMTLDLRHFQLLRVNGTVEGEKIRALGNDLMRDGLRDFIKAAEPMVKDYANDAIARSLKEGKGKISADALLKIAPAGKKADKGPK